MSFSISDLNYFAEVASMGNITKAAAKLGIRQSSLSQAIQKLERVVDAPLLMRGKSGVSLTQAGFTFLAHSKDLLKKWEEMGDLTRKSDREVSGRYSLGCHPALAIHILPSFLPGLFLEYPKLHLDLSHHASRVITEDVASFRLDFGIVADPMRRPDLVVRQLGVDTAGFFARASVAPLDPFPAGDHVLICDPDLYQTQHLSKLLERSGVRFKNHLYTPRLDVIAAIVGAGGGVGLLPGRAANLIRGPQLQMIQSLPAMKNSICLIYRRDAMKSAAFREIARYIESRSKWSEAEGRRKK